uniref:Venom protein family 2 protein 9 n=1 Tax=Lethocerus distinctifemur TaxID=280095 RepID=A0A2K8JW27_9HEMI|nr:venom protein family 2 protein 9 [Lethocerus distinctifemur]
MAVKNLKLAFVCYLMVSTLVFSMAKDAISDEEAQKVAADLLSDFEKELDQSESTALEDPDNDLDNEERPRFLFFLPFLPKLAILLVKIAIKAVPLIIKAAAVVKAKVAAVAATSLTKAALATAAKKAAVFVVKEVAIDTAFNYVVDKVKEAVKPADQPQQPQAPDPAKIHAYYEQGSEVCRCWKKKKCSCCVQPEGLEAGCFNMTMRESLWNKDSKIKIGVFYGGKMIVTRRIKVHRPRQRCAYLPKPFDKTNLCISSYGRSQLRKEVTQCFSVYFNNRGISKCIVQDRDLKLHFEEE